MKPHSEGFKQEITQMGRQLRGIITYGNTTLEEEIMAITPHYEANLLKSVMKQLDLELSIDIPLETVINCQIGIMVNDNYEMLNYGNYVVYSSEKQEDTNTYKIVCYDKMLYSMKQNEDLGVEYPISIKAYLTALANKIGLTLEDTSFNNQNLQIPSELYVGQEYTYRDILDEIAQATGSVICINDNDKLEVRYPNNLGAEVTATGKNITITEHEDNKISGLKIYGNSEQGSTTGKNKFDIFDLIKMSNSYSNYKNGYSFESIGTMYNIGVTLEKPIQLPVSFSYKIKNETGTNFRLIFEFDNGTSMNLIQYGSGTGTNERTITANNITHSGATTITKIKGDYRDGGRFTIYDFIINEGTTAESYEPYTGGQASPNPSYPQEIHSTGDSGSVNEKVQNKNLFDLKAYLTDREIPYTENEDGSLTFTLSQALYSNPLQFSEENVNVSLSGIITNGTAVTPRIDLLNENNTVVSSLYENNTKVQNVSTSKLRFNWSSIGTVTMKNIQLEQGTTATDYTAHEEQNISIPCQQPMRAIGEYKDTFVKVDGNWYERHYIGQKIFNGTETTFVYNASYQGFRYLLEDASLVSFNPQNDLMCSHFRVSNVRSYNSSQEPPIIRTYYGTTGLDAKYVFICDGNTDINVFKTWLSNNNVELLYVLETPIDIPCTEEQIEALNSLSYLTLYDGVTHINSDANIEFRYIAEYETIDEEFLKDVNVDFGQKYGPINSIVLSRAAESDNVYLRNERSVEQDGLCEIKIVDNQIMNFNNRSDFLQGILDALDGLEYYINDFNSPGILYLSLLDRYSIQIGENKYKSIMLNDEVNVTRGIEEIVHTDMPEQSETDYEKADKTDRRINQTYLIVDKQNQTIESVVSNVSEQNNKISQITQTVDEINSKLQDIADITTYGESDSGVVELEGINQSEPIMIKVHPTAVNISYLYTRNNLYPSNSLYMTTRTIRFIRTYQEDGTTKTENIDYELPDDLLRYSSEVYDEFYLDYDSQTCQVIKRCGYNADGTVYQLANETTINYPYPEILLNDGDYEIQLLGYDYGYLYVRLMAQNIYTTQFATKAEVTSSINQKAQEIDISVNQKLDSYPTKTEMNSAITVSANEINSTVSRKVGKDEIISSINQSAEAVSINAGKINLNGAVTANQNFKILTDGSMEAKNAKFNNGNIDLIGDEQNPTFNIYKDNSKNTNYRLYATSNFLVVREGARTYVNMQAADNQASSQISYDNSNYLTSRASSSGSSIFLMGSSGSTSIRNDGIRSPSITQTSLESDKKNFEKFEKGLDVLKDVDIYKYNLINEDDKIKKHIGFVIGKNYKYSKNVTSENNDGVDIYSFVSVCCQAIKEQQEQIEQMKEEIKELKGGNE